MNSRELSLSKIKALLIDQASEIEDIIKSLGFEYLDCVSRDIDARILMENKNKYDIIIYNTEIIQKPIDFLKFLKQEKVPDSVDFILVSQCSKKEDLVSAALGGIDDFIVRPISKEKFISRLKNLYTKKVITLLTTIEQFCAGALVADSFSGKNENRSKSNLIFLSESLCVLSKTLEILEKKRESDLFFSIKKICSQPNFEQEKTDLIFQHLINVIANYCNNHNDFSKSEERTMLLTESTSKVQSSDSVNAELKKTKTDFFLSKIKTGIENDRLKNF